MTRKLSSSRTVRWLGGLSVLFSVATAAVVLRGQEEDINPIGILFRRRDARNAKQDEKEKTPPGQLPSDVPKAPPAQFSQQKQAPAATPAVQNADPLMKYVDEALRLSQRRLLVAESANGNPNSPWQIMHGVLALRHNLELRTPRGTVNALGWLSRNPMFRGEAWFEATRFGGRAHPFSVPYHFEGHVNQFLSLLTMSNLPLDHKFGVAGGKGYVTMAEMVRHAQMMVNANEEISWTLWFLTHYLEPDAVWTNHNGERWGMEKLVAMQTGQNVTTAPCGGTHGLFALAYARNSYLQKHGKVTGTWLQADQKIQRYIAEASSGMNADGSFSSAFFREPKQHTDDPTDRLKSSGHMLEWLMMAVPQQDLKQNWVRYGVYRVAVDLIQFSNQEIDPGPLYHAVHAITLYRERVTPKQITPQNPRPLESELARTPKPQTAPPAAAPPKPTIDPKSVAATPSNPPPPRPVAEAPPGETKVVMAPANTPAPVPMPTAIPTPPPGSTAEPKVAVDTPKPIPSNQSASPVPMPEEPRVAANTPDKVESLVLPTLPAPGSGPSDPKRPPSALPIDKPVGLAATPPNPTPIDTPAATDEKPPVVPEVTVGALPVPPLPTFEISKGTKKKGSKPDAADELAPRPTTVSSPTPIVLPPLPLDPIDSSAAAEASK
ncbi:hypothetical protein Pan44_20580 [Caulifigura coniformis]|uniref:Uncharacterized protein n=1 Tax=Caulifigura coniformis TaxID=2527983 RepID=A0A517SD31_9PLAN|nr:hypothetical protein [Caulifigura coniformis]QDT54031.1 hypothetical protein Pan44_20580 [Caulifigura coniformis]